MAGNGILSHADDVIIQTPMTPKNSTIKLRGVFACIFVTVLGISIVRLAGGRCFLFISVVGVSRIDAAFKKKPRARDIDPEYLAFTLMGPPS